MAQKQLAYPHRGHTRRGEMQTGSIFSTTRDVTTDVLGGVVDTTESAGDVVLDTTSDAVGATTDVVGSVAGTTADIGASALGGTADAAGGAWDWAVTGTKSLIPGGQQKEPVTGGGIISTAAQFPTITLAALVAIAGVGLVFYKKNIQG